MKFTKLLEFFKPTTYIYINDKRIDKLPEKYQKKLDKMDSMFEHMDKMFEKFDDFFD